MKELVKDTGGKHLQMNVREETDFKTGAGYSVGAGVGKYFG